MSSWEQGDWACTPWESGCTTSKPGQVDNVPHGANAKPRTSLSKKGKKRLRESKRLSMNDSQNPETWFSRFNTTELVAKNTVLATEEAFLDITKGETLTLCDQAEVLKHNGCEVMVVLGSMPRFVNDDVGKVRQCGLVYAEDVEAKKKANPWQHQ